MAILGNSLALAALLVAIAAAWVTWRNPFLGLGVLVAGMGFHNFVIMTLVRLGTNHLLIRVVQGWKEGILALLVISAALRLLAAYRAGGQLKSLRWLDWIAVAFLAVMLLYLIIPSSVLHGHASFQQRLAAFRVAAYLPVLYALGRTFDRPPVRDLARVSWLIVGAAGIVGIFGLYELWLVPTRTWLDLGINDFSAWLGFHYGGPGHLPENFFQSLPSGLYLRRMVSTYLSPLGIAYTGLLVFPIGVVLVERSLRDRAFRALAILALGFLVTSVLFSVTRLAIFCLIAEAVLLALLMRRAWVIVTAAAVIAAAFAVLTIYPQVGPAVDANLVPGGPARGSILTAGDPSLLEHLKTLGADARAAEHHPLGEGLGSAGSSANRFTTGENANPDYAPGESAILTTFVDTGVIGGLAYLAFYFLGLAYAARAVLSVGFGAWESALPLSAAVGGLALIPITLTSDVWGDLSVLFLFWWTLGFSVSRAHTAEPILDAIRLRLTRPSPISA